MREREGKGGGDSAAIGPLPALAQCSRSPCCFYDVFAGACLGVPELPRSGGNFTEYKLRFHSTSLYAGANSGSGNNRYYSFNQGLTHFIVFSAEAYLYARDATFLANQAAFMQRDLAAVDRSVTPWVVALVHKDWTMETEAFAAFTPILDTGGVDVLFCGHVHCKRRIACSGRPAESTSIRTHTARAAHSHAAVLARPPPPCPQTTTATCKILQEATLRIIFRETPSPHLSPRCSPRSARRRPYDAVTGDIDTASVSADGSTYTDPKYMVTIVTGASGDIERE